MAGSPSASRPLLRRVFVAVMFSSMINVANEQLHDMQLSAYGISRNQYAPEIGASRQPLSKGACCRWHARHYTERSSENGANQRVFNEGNLLRPVREPCSESSSDSMSLLVG